MQKYFIFVQLIGQGLALPKPQGPGEHAHALSHIEQMFSSWHETYGTQDEFATGVAANFAELPGPMEGFGGVQPVDDLDALCYELYRYQQCIEMDVANGVYDPTPCVLNDGYYYKTFEATENGEIACSEEDYLEDGSYTLDQSYRNTNPCNHALCMGDRHFVNEVTALYESGTFDRTPAYFAMVQKGTYADTCVSGTSSSSSNSGSGGSSESKEMIETIEGVTQCCGFEVNRKPMNTAASQCCVNSSTGYEYLAGIGDICI